MKKVLFALMSMAVVMFTSCSKDDDNNGDNTESNVLATQDVNNGETLELDGGYVLNGTLSVKDGGTLNIAAGTEIVANEGFGKYIIVEQGGKINVKGTAALPVKMIGKEEKAGYWGGLIINGYGLVSGTNDPAVTANVGLTEVNSNLPYGGTIENDNSGSITYLILGQTGAKSSANVEHNGLTLNAVGSGTKIENIYVYQGADDAVEFFGGSVSVTNFLSVDSDDDMFDFTQGYTGTLTNAYGIWTSAHTSSEKDPRGVEADGNLDGEFPNHLHQSNFTIANMTIFHENSGTGTTAPWDAMQDAIKIRRGATAIITNAFVKSLGTIQDGVDLSDGNGTAADGTNISVKFEVATLDRAINLASTSATVTENAANSGCSTSIFDWTGFGF
ncbi:hypothetical protein [Maribellus sp. YY47]|uniref:hypothetical protein n=1 Tax=Maribellus sp. YY47 TaxID=2929486 RepID=UPI00200131E7|nr:hypothetical protein [Maribellus sp. YY47]MCK3686409.1 hypothetical protein [Maribellus sp. YY47]